MRISGGRWRSRRLRGPSRGMPLRPTPDAQRERVFNVLGPRVTGARFLDLFAGTGAVGLEAMSRGAVSVVFVERHRAAVRIIEGNRDALGAPDGSARILSRPARRAISELARRGEVFDLAWADPPFEIWEEGLEVLAEAFACGVIAAGAIACLECPAEADLEEIPEPLTVRRDLRGGASRVVMLVLRAGLPTSSRSSAGPLPGGAKH